ncbi:MAG: glycoside hydrolase family 3 C-terminal domain-containing protein, partial [Oscillospiraceae bacterium]|nr:glycoside hydrolase family 3 C-terminal domain-containing protein [Oscillospiraceae bacterium]
MRHKKHLSRFLSLTLAMTLMASLLLWAAPTALADTDPPPSFPFTKVYDYYDPGVDAGDRLDDLINRMTLDEKMASGAGARLGVSGSRSGGGEGLHGVAWDGYATVFPSSLGLSQSWDEDLFARIGDVIAKESLASSINAAGRLAPVVDLLRDPRYGRAYETLGEDAYLTGSLATAMAAAMNGRKADGYQQFIPILKHFMAYNAEINRLWVASSFSPRNTNEYYNKAFKYPVSAGASKSLMNSYPVVNGKPMSVNPLQYDLLYKWTPDYDGTGHYEYTTTNDYGSGSSIIVHSQRYFDDTTNGRALGMAQGTKNGQQSWSFRDFGSADGLRYDALARGMVTEKDFEENARRSLAMALRLGDLDQLRIANPYLQDPLRDYGSNRDYQIKRNRGLALRAAQEQIVLLKNEGNTLPLNHADVDKAVLLGPLADQVLKDFYSGSYTYRITIKDALINKLGAANVAFNRAVDTVAIKAPNGKYLVNNNTAKTYVAPGSPGTGLAPITATGSTKPASLTDNVASLFEIYDYGSANKLLRTPVNGRYVQVTSLSSNPSLTMINNTSAPGEGNLDEAATGQNLTYSNYQKFRIVPVTGKAGTFGLYHVLSGDGVNGGLPLAYDVDDEDTNRGSYLTVNTANRVVADIDGTNGPYRNETHTKGPNIVNSPVDVDGNDEGIDRLPASHQFVIEDIQTAQQAAKAAVDAAADPNAPIILVLGYEPHLNAREGIDLYETGLSEQQMRLIEYVTGATAGGGLDRDVILIVKTGNPMAIDESVFNNAKVKAILEIGHTGQEEGSAIVSALFDNGYSVPATGFAPSGEYANEGLSYHHDFEDYPGYLPENRTIPAYAPAGRLSSTWYKSTEDMIGASEDHPPASYLYPDYDVNDNDNLSNMNGTINTGLLTYDIIKGARTYQYFQGTPLFEFGYGLTYTDFVYSDVTVGSIGNGKFTVSGKV